MISRILSLASLVAISAFADPLTITISGTGSGALNGITFTAAQFTFTMTTDTSKVVKPPCCTTLDTASGSPTTFSIANAGSGTLTDNQAVFVSPTSYIIGLAHFNDGDIVDLSDISLSGYTFNKSLGPLTGTPSFVGKCPGIDCSGFQTSAGPLNFSLIGTVTFNIVVGPATTAAPVISKALDRATGSARLAAGVPLEITGTGLGTSGSDAPTFTIAGKPAPILQFISPTDVVVQIPVDAPVGATTVTAAYKGVGVTSAAFNIVLDTFAPAIYGPAAPGGSAFYNSGRQPITSTNPTSANQQVYAVLSGLGPTTPAQVANTMATVSTPTNSPVQVMVGNKLITPDYAGLFVGGTPGTYQVLFKLPADVAVGAQPVVISVGGKSSNTATLTVAPPMPSITGIVNGASFKNKPVAPNSFVSIFGLNFGSQDTPASIFPATTFSDVSVLFNGVPAQLYFVFGSLGQINLVTPSNLPESGTAMVQVKTAQGISAAFSLQMAASDVGLFRIADPSKASRNNGAILFANTVWRVMPASMAAAIGFPNCNGATPATVCGQAAAAGDSLQIFLTGLGKATPDGDPTGQPLAPGSVAPVSGVPLYRTVLAPTVTIGGLPAPVVFSGITPGNAGLYQINVAVPDGVAINDDVPIVATMPNGSTDTVTIGTRTK